MTNSLHGSEGLLKRVYSPTPEIIFEQPTAAINNAIQVSVEFAEQILLSIAPDVRLKSADEALSESIIAENLIPEIGAEPLSTQDLTKIDHELKENPPQRFDAARKVRVYQGEVMADLGAEEEGAAMAVRAESCISMSTMHFRAGYKPTCRAVKEAKEDWEVREEQRAKGAGEAKNMMGQFTICQAAKMERMGGIEVL